MEPSADAKRLSHKHFRPTSHGRTPAWAPELYSCAKIVSMAESSLL